MTSDKGWKSYTCTVNNGIGYAYFIMCELWMNDAIYQKIRRKTNTREIAICLYFVFGSF